MVEQLAAYRRNGEEAEVVAMAKVVAFLVSQMVVLVAHQKEGIVVVRSCLPLLWQTSERPCGP